MKRDLYAVILAGGSGTRFWPLSRETFPKQLLRLDGEQTLLQRAVALGERLRGGEGKTVVVSHKDQADAVRLQLGPSGSGADVELLLEPMARNTGAAIGLAAVAAAERSPDAVLIVLPADHMIRKPGAFLRAVGRASALAEEGYLVTFGIPPDRPETGFGYIRAGGPLKGTRGKKDPAALSVRAFVEKPDRRTAERYVRKGDYYWNSGIFVFQAATMLEAIGCHMPGLGRGLRRIREASGKPSQAAVIGEIYRRLPSVSIDYGVLERMERSRLAVLPVQMGWSDLGSWSALHEVLPTDREGNVRRGNVIALGCRDSVLYADRRPVAAIGLKDLVVVDTPDATLVCGMDRVQDVRKAVEILKKRGAEEQKTPKTVERPWGNFTVLESGPGYKIKRIEVVPGKRLSLQLHHHRSEHWVVVKGTARVTRNDETYDVRAGESTFIPMEARHRIANPGTGILEIIEVQNGDYLGEDDIVRFQDDFGRNVK